ncbi:hypothetical protein tb265_28720 [Gemmatimonadetes bacterium T265]|nr:hypothetical protein tb265_28720 [Gemmatimonadetes bacterium T265]
MSGAGGAASPDSFASLVADVTSALDEAIPAWRVRVSAEAAEWRRRGVDASILERALALTSAPDVDGLLATFSETVQQLAALEAEAVALDPSLAGSAAFRDPARLREGAALAAECRERAAAARAGFPDPEHWVLQWPAAGDLLAGELA